MLRSDPTPRPTLLSSCALATTAAEARFRIDRPITPTRAARVIALDAAAAGILQPVAELPWGSARFYQAGRVVASNGGPGDLALDAFGGGRALLSIELDDADMALVVATTAEGRAAATVIGESCMARGLMTAGVVLSGAESSEAAVSALRPNARVLIVSSDEHDVIDVLMALRV